MLSGVALVRCWVIMFLSLVGVFADVLGAAGGGLVQAYMRDYRKRCRPSSWRERGDEAAAA